MTRILSETFAPPITATSGGFGVLEQGVEDLQFLLDEEADAAAILGEAARDGHHRRLVAMRRAEGVVDVNVSERSEFGGEGLVALLLAFVEADVFEDDDPAGLERRAGRLRLRADGVVDLPDGPADQLLAPGGDRVHLELGVLFGDAGRAGRGG